LLHVATARPGPGPAAPSLAHEAYGEKSRAYPGHGCRTDFDLVVDFGVPAAARWAGGRGIESLTVFDHAWSKTLRMIGDRQGGPEESRAGRPPEEQAWERLVREVSEDERTAGQVFLFPPFLTPAVFSRHWREVLGRRVSEIGAVFGGRPAWTMEENRATAARMREVPRSGERAVAEAALDRLGLSRA